MIKTDHIVSKKSGIPDKDTSLYPLMENFKL